MIFLVNAFFLVELFFFKLAMKNADIQLLTKFFTSISMTCLILKINVNECTICRCGPISGNKSGTSSRNFRPKWLPPGYKFTLFHGNPVFGFRMQLYCRTGFLLAIFPDKKVRGTDEDTNPYGRWTTFPLALLVLIC